MKKAGYQLSSAYIAYIMDPRNFLDETNIFQFQSLGIFSLNDTFDQEYNAILKGTFMEGTKKYSTESINYANTFLDVAKNTGVSAYHLASRVKAGARDKRERVLLFRVHIPDTKDIIIIFNFNANRKHEG